ncbi:MAG: outer membrane beta-barrel protein [Bacteroidetes bacterium]|nr:outer membrane beta-barrel protein [Bacteroidota bacterium]
MRRLQLLIAIACMPFVSMAQGPAGAVKKILPKIDLGIKVVANFQNLDGKEWESGYKPGFGGGIFGGVMVGRFGGSAEFILSSVKYTGSGIDFYNSAKNSNLVYNNASDSAKKGEFAVTYLNIPILLNVKMFGPLTLQVGPQYSGVLGIKDKSSLLKDTKGLIKSGDFSGVLGLQLNFTKLRITGRYVIGLSDVNDLKGGVNSWKTRTIQLGVGYTFL